MPPPPEPTGHARRDPRPSTLHKGLVESRAEGERPTDIQTARHLDAMGLANLFSPILDIETRLFQPDRAERRCGPCLTCWDLRYGPVSQPA